MAIFTEPYAPALAAVRALVPARTPGGAASEAQTLLAHVLTRVHALTDAGGPVSSAESDELRAQIERVVALVCPLDVTDVDERRVNAERRVFIEDAFRLATAHLDL